MSDSPIEQPDLNAAVRDKLGALMLSLWQQEAYIKALEEYVAQKEAEVKEEVAS